MNLLHRVLIASLLCSGAAAAQAPGEWSSIGPISAAYTTEVSGRATVLEVNPQNPADLWVGTANGGVWHTNNARETSVEWEYLSGDAATQAVGAIALSDCNNQRCNTVFVGTGENNIRRDTYYGKGLYRLDWNSSSNVYDLSVVGNTDTEFALGSISRILLDGNDIYISVMYGKTASASSTIRRAPAPPAGFGVFRSTDGGITWSKLGNNPDNAVPTDIEFSNGKLFAGFLEQGIFVLTPSNEWCPLGPGAQRPTSCATPISPTLPNPSSEEYDFVEIAVAPDDDSVMYTVYGKCQSETWLCDQPPQFFRSGDGGDTWTSAAAATIGDPISTYSRYTHALTVNPAVSNNVFYGGIVLWSSGDQGDNFFEIDTWGVTHPDVQDFRFADPSNRNIVYLANDGGVYRSDNFLSPLRTWQSINFGITSMQFYALCHDVSGVSNLVMGGTQDNGTQLFNGTLIWERMTEGDGGFCAIQNPNVGFTTMQEISPHQSSSGMYSAAFQSITSGIDLEDAVLVTPPMEQNTETGEVYFGTERLYRWSASGQKWETVSPIFDPSTTIQPDLERRNLITAIAPSRSNPHRIYVGMHDGSIWRTSNCGPCVRAGCWQKISGPPLPNGIVTSIEVAPTDADTAYVTYTSFGAESKVWRTRDGGLTWIDYSNGLPNVPLKVVRAHPNHPSRLWLGSDTGVFFRDGDAMDWTPYTVTQGMPRVPVFDIRIDEKNGRVYAGTHGRGAFMLTNTAVLFAFNSWINDELTQVTVFGHGFSKGQEQSCTVSIANDMSRRSKGALDAVASGVRTDRLGRIGSPLVLMSQEQSTEICNTADGCSRKTSSLLGDFSGGELTLSCGNDAASAAVPRQPIFNQAISSTQFFVRKSHAEASGVVSVTLKSTGVTSILGKNGTKDTVSIGITVEDDHLSISKKITEKLLSLESISNRHLTIRLNDPHRKIEGEDLDRKRRLRFISLHSKEPGTGQLFTEMSLPPGKAIGLEATIENIGLFHLGELTPVSVDLSTLEEGAAGGSIVISNRSILGFCTVKVTTHRGESAESVAQRVFDGLTGSEVDGRQYCDRTHSPADLLLDGSSIRSSMSRGLRAYTTDPNVGIDIRLAKK